MNKYFKLDFDIEELRHNYKFTSKAIDSVPQAIYCFLISDNFEDSIRKALSIGGDCDTIACITGSISEAYYGIPEKLINDVINDLDGRIYFTPQDSVTNCNLNMFGLGSSYYNCVSDDDDLVNFYNSIYLNYFYEFESESNVALENTKCYDGCDICIGSTKYDCSCNFKNNDEKLFLGNVSNHFCRKFKYTNFAKAQKKEVNVPGSGDKFTLHFWAFAYSYVDKVFEGFEIEWKNHVTVKVYLDSTRRYNFNCVINGDATSKLIDFNMNTWNFVHCAVVYLSQKPHQYFITTEEDSFEGEYNGTKPSNLGEDTKLIIKWVGGEWLKNTKKSVIVYVPEA